MANNILILDALSSGQVIKTQYNSVANTHIPVHRDPPSNTVVVATVTASQSTKVLLAANPDRVGVEFFNDSNDVAWVLRGAGSASNSNYSFQMTAGSFFSENPGNFTGAFQAIWKNANGAIQVTEFTN